MLHYSVSGYARHLDGALAELGVDHVHIVAHDSGGAWALAWAARHPEKFRATPAEALAAPAQALAALDRPAVVIWGESEAYLPLEQAGLTWGFSSVSVRSQRALVW